MLGNISSIRSIAGKPVLRSSSLGRRMRRRQGRSCKRQKAGRDDCQNEFAVSTGLRIIVHAIVRHDAAPFHANKNPQTRLGSKVCLQFLELVSSVAARVRRRLNDDGKKSCNSFPELLGETSRFRSSVGPPVPPLAGRMSKPPGAGDNATGTTISGCQIWKFRLHSPESGGIVPRYRTGKLDDLRLGC